MKADDDQTQGGPEKAPMQKRFADQVTTEMLQKVGEMMTSSER